MTLQGSLGGVRVGDEVDVAVMGALNVSPESFYAGSVTTSADQLARRAEAMVRAGAAVLDVGAMSTAPYLSTGISEDEEADRLRSAVVTLASAVGVPISADTSRSGPARAAIASGARIVNDVSGLTADPELAVVVAQAGAGLILMASEPTAKAPAGAQVTPGGLRPIDAVSALLRQSVDRARRAGIPADAIVIDPGIGFFRRSGVAWHDWDVAVLASLDRLRELGNPICVGVSRKSFIGALTGEPDPAKRLAGSIAAATAAVLAGAHVIRTHDVVETVQATRIALAIRRSAGARAA
jgi:dihydropteroate synthase